MTRTPAFILALMCTCLGCGGGGSSGGSRVYDDTWQPLLGAQGGALRPLVTDALLLEDDDLASMKAVGGEIIGFHHTRRGWARRAGSTGGTHFFPVAPAAPNEHPQCGGLGGLSACRAPAGQGWSRVAVIRVEPSMWHELPERLIPPRSVVEPNTPYSAVRVDCVVHRARGAARCRGDVHVEAR